MENEVIRLQGIDNYFENWAKLYQQGQKYIFKYKRVYELKWNNNSQHYILEERENLRVYNEQSYTLRGKFVAFNAKEANNLLGLDYFNQ